jgi:hypothetical protein
VRKTLARPRVGGLAWTHLRLCRVGSEGQEDVGGCGEQGYVVELRVEPALGLGPTSR